MHQARPKITFDTNCLINLFDANSTTATSVPQLAALVRFAMDGKAEIAVTTRLSSDLSQDRDEVRRAEISRTLELFPVMGTVMKLETSKLGDGDRIAGSEHIRLHDEIQAIIFPTLNATSKSYGNKINDIDHLVGHVLNKRDIFVTDDTDILRRRDTLCRAPGIVVMTPADCVRHLEDIVLRSAPVTFPSDGINPQYHSPALTGVVTFDYSNNSQRYAIGEGQFLFETQWSKASDTSIYAVRDAPSVGAIALAKGYDDIPLIKDAAAFDFSSRHRTPSIGSIVIWRNVNGLYAATKILGIKDDSRGADRDELTYAYAILVDGGTDFSKAGSL